MPFRHYSVIDKFFIELDETIRPMVTRPQSESRPNPAQTHPEQAMATPERRHAAGLMRVNHTGEVCAQALYQGQQLTAQAPDVRNQLAQAAVEESDHLHWCKTRLHELHSRASLLNPLFFAGAFAIGALNGKLGDRWNLGFLAETERQVVRHLEKQLARLPAQDIKSRLILEKMKAEEATHASDAQAAGGLELPLPVRLMMRASAKLMTKTTYWI